jgi:hypothetical protein
VYDEGHEPRSFEEADHAALGLLWRHRRTFAEGEAIGAFAELHGRPPTDEELSDARSRWVRMLMSEPEPLREAIEDSCEALFEIADRSCPTRPGVPTGIRTPVAAVKGRCPRPLDDGDRGAFV